MDPSELQGEVADETYPDDSPDRCVSSKFGPRYTFSSLYPPDITQQRSRTIHNISHLSNITYFILHLPLDFVHPEIQKKYSKIYLWDMKFIKKKINFIFHK